MVEFQKIRHLLSCSRRAIEAYGMIEEGDRIAVGLSGGKDSLALFCVLVNLQRFYPKHFELVGITVSMGFEGMDFSPLREFCLSCGADYKLVESELLEILTVVGKQEPDEKRAAVVQTARECLIKCMDYGFIKPVS